MKACTWIFGAAIAVAVWTSPARAYLGSFEFGDGYEYGAPMGFNLGDNDVTRYNAGQFGTNNGGPGGPVNLIVPDSGLWRVIAGGRLLNQANDYYVIRHSAPGGHSSPNVLGMTTGNSSYVGVDSAYQYDFEARDFDGTAPAALSGGSVAVSFLWCPQNAAPSTLASPGATIQFQDSAGTTWFELGTYAPTQSVSYRVGGGPWTATGFNTSAAFSDFDSVSLNFDLLNDTVDFSFFETAAATNHVVLVGAPLGGNMNYLAHMGLTMKAENTKNFLDDFDFQVNVVPEPATATLLALAAFGLCRGRRTSL
jgi:hypothetical protein